MPMLNPTSFEAAQKSAAAAALHRHSTVFKLMPMLNPTSSAIPLFLLLLISPSCFPHFSPSSLPSNSPSPRNPTSNLKFQTPQVHTSRRLSLLFLFAAPIPSPPSFSLPPIPSSSPIPSCFRLFPPSHGPLPLKKLDLLSQAYHTTPHPTILVQEEGSPCYPPSPACHGSELNGNHFSGSIPPAIFTLTQVTILGMRSNALTGDIPASIGSLASILVLDLSDNSLTGTVPAVMGKLAKLDEINVNSTGPSKVLCAAAGVCVVNQVATSAFCKKCTTFCKVCTPPGNNTNPAAVPTPAVPVPPVPAPTATPPVASPPPPAPSPTTAAPPPAPVTASPSTPTASPPPPAAAPGAPAATVPSPPPPRAGAIYGVGFGTLLASLVSAMALDLLL
ncbi:unnamed protein product [Closterium sp. Naga37s-1]|nr:unnamed protein product [Closterium sp. Naga37s-1]